MHKKVRIKNMEYVHVVSVQTHELKRDIEATDKINPYWLIPSENDTYPEKPSVAVQKEILFNLIQTLSIRSVVCKENGTTSPGILVTPKIPDDYDDECKAMITPAKRKRGRPRNPLSEDEEKIQTKRICHVAEWCQAQFNCEVGKVEVDRSAFVVQLFGVYCNNKRAEHDNNATYAVVRTWGSCIPPIVPYR